MNGVLESPAFEITARGAPDAPRRLLVEVPHGATTPEHWSATRARLVGDFPEGLEDFYWVNTDVGAPEIAFALQEELAAEGWRVDVLRGVVPRTFVDLNRGLEVGADSYRHTGVTPSVPAWVRAPEDVAVLEAAHASYQEEADRLFEAVCGMGGLALALHTYAPRSVQLGDIDDGIVAALRAAYRPGTVESWPLRPEVDLITTTPDGDVYAEAELVGRVRAELGAEGFEVEENSTYRLIPGTMAARRSASFPKRVLCLEFRRDLLVDEWIPFRPLRTGAGVERAAAGLARAFRGEDGRES